MPHINTTGTVVFTDDEREVLKLYAAQVRKNNPGASFTWRHAAQRAVKRGLDELAGKIMRAEVSDGNL